MAEIEMKLDVPAKSAAKLLRRPWLKRLECGPVKSKRLFSVYYDTPKLKLRRAGISLRVRRIDGRYVQTVKADPHGAGGPFGKDEWETEIARSDPDLRRAKDTALDRFKRKKLRRQLRPVFATDVRRMAMLVRLGGSEMELAFDRGKVKAGRRHATISEIEIELKRGDPAQIVKLAKRIAHETRAGFGSAAKTERGYALRANEAPHAMRAEEVELDPNATATEAFQVVALSCLRQIDGNRDAVDEGDPEGVHQMRVGVRRLRAAMSFFKDLVQDSENEDTKSELDWLREKLGPARDLDVLIAEGVEPLRRARVDGAAVTALEADLARQRRSSLGRVRAATNGEHYRRLVLKAALWIVGGEWSRTGDPALEETRGRNVLDFVDQELSRRHRKIIKKLKKLEELDARGRHKLRIAAKKLRYADEFFASLYRGNAAARRLKRHRAVLKQLQSALGKLNDLQVHDEMARALVSSEDGRKKSQKSFAMGLVSGTDHASAKPLMGTAEKAGRALAAQKPFWK